MFHLRFSFCQYACVKTEDSACAIFQSYGISNLSWVDNWFFGSPLELENHNSEKKNQLSTRILIGVYDFSCVPSSKGKSELFCFVQLPLSSFTGTFLFWAPLKGSKSREMQIHWNARGVFFSSVKEIWTHIWILSLRRKNWEHWMWMLEVASGFCKYDPLSKKGHQSFLLLVKSFRTR